MPLAQIFLDAHLLKISLEIICIAKTCKRFYLVVSGPSGLTARAGGLTVCSPERKFSGGPGGLTVSSPESKFSGGSGGLTAMACGLTVSSPESNFSGGAGGLTDRSPLF